MTGEERLMLRMALQWAPYGGPPAELLFTEFGMEEDVFWHRFGSVVSARARVPQSLSLEDRILVGRACAYERGGRRLQVGPSA